MSRIVLFLTGEFASSEWKLLPHLSELFQRSTINYKKLTSNNHMVMEVLPNPTKKSETVFLVFPTWTSGALPL